MLEVWHRLKGHFEKGQNLIGSPKQHPKAAPAAAPPCPLAQLSFSQKMSPPPISQKPSLASDSTCTYTSQKQHLHQRPPRQSRKTSPTQSPAPQTTPANCIPPSTRASISQITIWRLIRSYNFYIFWLSGEEINSQTRVPSKNNGDSAAFPPCRLPLAISAEKSCQGTAK